MDQPIEPGAPLECGNVNPDPAPQAQPDGRARALLAGPATNLPEKLDRKELLAAVDYEISQREGAISRHGINMWALIGGLVALGWADLLEVTERSHDWNVVLLVFFCGSIVLAPITMR